MPRGSMLVAAGAILVACILAWSAAWTCDDAYITFRYVRHWVSGDGLVFNAGERIEGFSNFLFVVLLSPAALAGAKLAVFANLIGIGATAVQIGFVVWLLDRRKVPVPVIGAIALMFATDRIGIVWATGGLETATHGALVVAALALQLEKPQRVRTLAGVHAALAASRPEGIVFAVIWLAHLAIARRADLRRAINWLVPMIAVLLAARLLYYGELVANPYRAKVGGVPVTQFGPGYALSFLRRMGLFGIPALATLPLLALAARSWRAIDRAAALAGAFVVVQVIIIGASGGDYMNDFRLLAPVVAPFYVAIGLLAAAAWRTRLLAIGALAVFAAGHGIRQLDPAPVFPTAPPSDLHKRQLTIPADEPDRFAREIAVFAEPGDSILADWAGWMSYGHDLRTIDATGLLSAHISRDFYLRPEQERLPGHARWPTIELMQREHLTIIFPKVNRRPPEDPEITADSPARRRDYPFLHVTVPLPDGQFLRFFTAMTTDELARRAAAKGITVCVRPPLGVVSCIPGAPAPATR